MMKRLNVFFISAVFILMAGTGVLAENYRDIFSYSRYSFDDDSVSASAALSTSASALSTSEVMENTFFLKAAYSTSVFIKSFQDVRDGWKNNIISTGTVYMPDKASHVEITYGYGKDSEDNRAHYYVLNITEEDQKQLVGLGAQYNKYSGYDYTALLVSSKYEINKTVSIQGKYYLSHDSEHHYDYRLWSELEYTAYRKIYLDIGGAIGDRFYTEEYGPKSRGDYYSIEGGVGLKLSENMSMRYNYEYIRRETDFSDTNNTVSLDWKF